MPILKLLALLAILISCDGRKKEKVESISKEDGAIEPFISERLMEALQSKLDVNLEVYSNIKDLSEEQDAKEMARGGKLTKEKKLFLLKQLKKENQIKLDPKLTKHSRPWGELYYKKKNTLYGWSIWQDPGQRKGLFLENSIHGEKIFFKIEIP